MEANYSLIFTLAIVTITFVIFLFALKTTRGISPTIKNEILNQLDDIKYSMQMNSSSSNRDGIVRLDSLLSKSLQLKNKNSLNCGENLKKSKIFIGRTYYEDIWHYHKLRNSIVHENIEINNSDAIDAYRTYSSVINKLLK